MDSAMYSIGELARSVNAWCKEGGIEPLHQGASEEVTVRNIRYYQAIGLVDRPLNKRGGGFSEKHRLQLSALRLLQGRGMTLGRIAALLKDLSEEELREIESGCLDEGSPGVSNRSALEQVEGWEAQAVSPDMWLLRRSGVARLTTAQCLRIQEIVSPERGIIPEQKARAKVSERPGPQETEGTTLEETELTTFRPEMD